MLHGRKQRPALVENNQHQHLFEYTFFGVVIESNFDSSSEFGALWGSFFSCRYCQQVHTAMASITSSRDMEMSIVVDLDATKRQLAIKNRPTNE